MSFTTSAGQTLTNVFLNKLIEESEQTKTDETVIRIEAGRSLRGVYYTASDAPIQFTTELQGALSGFAATIGLTIASCATLLAF